MDSKLGGWRHFSNGQRGDGILAAVSLTRQAAGELPMMEAQRTRRINDVTSSSDRTVRFAHVVMRRFSISVLLVGVVYIGLDFAVVFLIRNGNSACTYGWQRHP
jgi:hypothetical protein